MGKPDRREVVLRERVQDLYATFGGYSLAATISPDPCFPGACDDRPLRAEPLDRLPGEAFDWYPWKAITTWGSVDDFKHFLPRLLDLIAAPQADGATSPVEAWVVFGKLTYAQWQRWPSAEREALDAYFDALWKALLARSVHLGEPWRTVSLGHWLNAYGHARQDLGRYLAQWEAEARHPTEGLMPAPMWPTWSFGPAGSCWQQRCGNPNASAQSRLSAR